MPHLHRWLAFTHINGAAWLRVATCILLKAFLHRSPYIIDQFTLFFFSIIKGVLLFFFFFLSYFEARAKYVFGPCWGCEDVFQAEVFFEVLSEGIRDLGQGNC